jgi:hypothetical protein
VESAEALPLAYAVDNLEVARAGIVRETCECAVIGAHGLSFQKKIKQLIIRRIARASALASFRFSTLSEALKARLRSTKWIESCDYTAVMPVY